MTLLAPAFLIAAAVGALAAVALHLLAWRRPPAEPLPTARFVPEETLRVVARAMHPSDLWLLVLRVTLVLLVGLALARPVVSPRRSGTARVLIVDRSRAVADVREVRDSALALLREGDAVILFDSSAHRLAGTPRDSLGALTAVRAIGSLSAALVAARRAAADLERSSDSVELVLISPLVAEEMDAATRSIRELWPGAIRSVRPSTAGPPPLATRISIAATGEDAIVAAGRLEGALAEDAPVRILRSAATASDSAWVRGDARVLVVWPASLASVGWQGAADTPGWAVAAGTHAFVAAGLSRGRPPTGRVVARWFDGDPAATETPLGGGCIRSVAIGVPTTGDAAITPGFRQLLRRFAEPCGGAPRLEPVGDSVTAWLAAPSERHDSLGGGRQRRRSALGEWERGGNLNTEDSRPGLEAWLIGAAIIAALLELALRRRRADELA